MYWSPSSESSLAEAEIEYHDKRSASIYVAFDVKDSKGKVDSDAQYYLDNYTMDNSIKCGNYSSSRAKYGQYNVNGHKYIVAQALSEAVAEALGWDKDSIQLEKEFTGKELNL